MGAYFNLIEHLLQKILPSLSPENIQIVVENFLFLFLAGVLIVLLTDLLIKLLTVSG